jgi:hypothetical protein
VPTGSATDRAAGDLMIGPDEQADLANQTGFG